MPLFQRFIVFDLGKNFDYFAKSRLLRKNKTWHYVKVLVLTYTLYKLHLSFVKAEYNHEFF